MGTRHLIAAKIDGEYKIAQYGQWDGYPSGQGQEVLNFLWGMDRKNFEDKLRKCSFYQSQDEMDDDMKAANVYTGNDWMTLEQAAKFKAAFPHLSRDTGAEILNMVANSEIGLKLTDSLSFAADSLFCEWAYVLDFDENTFEVFKGFNKEPVPDGDRFASLPREKRPNGEESEYFPIKIVMKFKLDEVPATFEDFNQKINAALGVEDEDA